MTLDQLAVLCDALDISVHELLDEVTEYLSNRQLHASPIRLVESGDRLDRPERLHSTLKLDPWARAAAERFIGAYVGAARDDYDLIANDSIDEAPSDTDADYDSA